jgi:hypothetical protein
MEQNSSDFLSNLDQYAKMPPTDTSIDAIWMVLILQIQCTRNVTQDQNESDILILLVQMLTPSRMEGDNSRAAVELHLLRCV